MTRTIFILNYAAPSDGREVFWVECPGVGGWVEVESEDVDRRVRELAVEVDRRGDRVHIRESIVAVSGCPRVEVLYDTENVSLPYLVVERSEKRLGQVKAWRFTSRREADEFARRIRSESWEKRLASAAGGSR